MKGLDNLCELVIQNTSSPSFRFSPCSVTIRLVWNPGSVFTANSSRLLTKGLDLLIWPSKWNPQKLFNRSYLQERKMEKRGQKELLTTLESLNYKKSSQQLSSCFIAMRDSPFCKMFSPLILLWARKDVEKLFEEMDTIKIKKKRRSRDEKLHLGLGNT